MKINFSLIILLLSVICSSAAAQKPDGQITPKQYICYRATESLVIDGLLNENSWLNTEWTDHFLDIEGNKRPMPYFETKAKMLWDDTYLYIAAYLEETDVWATLTERESIIFNDNDFEVFIDPDGDTHNYIELEINAFNTQWDLLLLRPYRDEAGKNIAVDNWSINGLKSAVWIDGTINNGNDKDRGWYIEIAIPLDAIAEVHSKPVPPSDGEQYRINFSRVQWQTEWVDGKYIKKQVSENGKSRPLPEYNWVWTEQGVIAMHQPETWGYLQFSYFKAGEGQAGFKENKDAEAEYFLRRLYFAQREYFEKNKSYTTDAVKLGLTSPLLKSLSIILTFSGYEARVGHLSIDEQGKLIK